MSLKTEVIKSFVEDHPNDIIMIECDNQHIFYDNILDSPPLIWDWDNECFIAYRSNEWVQTQSKRPVQHTIVSLEEILFLSAFIDQKSYIERVNAEPSYDDEDKAKAKEVYKNLVFNCHELPNQGPYGYKNMDSLKK